MSNKRSDWPHRIARGQSNTARRAGVAFFLFSVLLLPVLYVAYHKAFAAPARGVLAHLLSAVVCVVWLAFANDIRKFANGERLISYLRSSDTEIRTVGNLSKHTFARWAIVFFDSVVLSAIAWFAYVAWFS